ncbi:hypothetical protein C8R46DRAFT_1352113 [Mycena filopes]|nr:hypothetical protein C8R46DRAFT_1352113 [Mycena filopes]
MSTPVAGAPEPATHRFCFPPFPEAPDGVTILPYKDFKEHGIQMRLSHELVERDGLGIPTVPLRVRHDKDTLKTNPNRRPKTAKELAKAARALRARKKWWEHWEEGEDLRIHGPYNLNSPRVDRFHQAAADFERYRIFPPMCTNVRWLWDQFRIFSGLTGTTPVAQEAPAATSSAGGSDPCDDDLGDEEGDSQSESKSPQNGERRFPPPQEERATEFLDDPARAVRVFLSSYMRNQGIVYPDRNFVYTTHLIRFFFNYLLRNRVFSDDKVAERSLRTALDIIDDAANELPLTAKLAKALPDEFSAACRGLWGRRTNGAVDPAGGDAAFESALEEDSVEVIQHADNVPSHGPVADDGDDDDLEPTTPPLAESEPEEHGAAYDPEAFTPAPQDFAAWAATLEWVPSPPVGPTLAALGLGALAYTRRGRPKAAEEGEEAGVEADDPETVERALEVALARAVLGPWLSWDVPSASTPGGEVVWGAAAAADNAPRVLGSSRGMVVLPTDPAASASASAPSPPSPTSTSPVAPTPATGPALPAQVHLGPGGLKPHDPLHDDLTLLLDPPVARVLTLGMGFGATWVQLARVQDLGPSDPAPDAAPEKLTEARKERQALRYWYLDGSEQKMVLPSYWLA